MFTTICLVIVFEKLELTGFLEPTLYLLGHKSGYFDLVKNVFFFFHVLEVLGTFGIRVNQQSCDQQFQSSPAHQALTQPLPLLQL